jgi:ribosomal protein L11 methyltransferase
LAVDNDPLAVEAATENAVRNRLASRMEVRLSDGTDLDGRYQLIVANIQLNTLAGLAPILMKLLDRGGVMLLSGILKDQQEELIRSYRQLRLQKRTVKGEWACLELWAD